METLRTYSIGFALSLILTLAAFGVAQWHQDSGHVYPPHEVALLLLVCLAVIQLFVQLALFLHVGRESKPHWNLAALAFALTVVVILIGGTLWIMHNLEQGQLTRELFTDGIPSPHTQND